MKITTGGTGMISSQSSMTASVLQQAIAALNYNYTWAIDFGLLTDVTTQLGNWLACFPTSSTLTNNGLISNVGIRGKQNFTSAGGSAFQISEASLLASAHSYGSTANQFPPGIMPDVDAGSSYPPYANIPESAVLNHDGRYLSIVATIDTYTIDSSHSSNRCQHDMTVQLPDAGNQILIYGNNDTSPIFQNGNMTHLNGVEGAGLQFQADYDAILGEVVVMTYDLAGCYAGGDPSDDASLITILPARSRIIDVDITYHGFIFSDTPPNAITLPVEITNPTIGSGPA